MALAGPSDKNTYVVLKSLDLICESPEEQLLWCRAVCSISTVTVYNRKVGKVNKFGKLQVIC